MPAAKAATTGWASENATGGYPLLDAYYVVSGNNVDIDATGKRDYIAIRHDQDENTAVTASIGNLSLKAGQSVLMETSRWGSGRTFELLTINKIEASASFNLTATGQENSFVINEISGTVASLSNSANLIIGSESTTTTFGGTISNTGTLTVNGAISITNVDNFTKAQEGTETWSDTTNNQGFKVTNGATYILATGGVTFANANQVDDNGTKRNISITDGTATFTGGAVTGTTYYITNSDVTAGSASTTGATGYDVARGRTLYIVDNSADNVALNLQEGSTISISNASRTFTANNRAQNVIIGNGGTVTISGESGGTAHIRGDIDVMAGGKLVLGAADSLGWETGAPKSLDLTGSEGALATVELTGKQTLSTPINLNGYAIMTNAGDGALEFLGGNITASGTDNTIAGNLMARSAATITVAQGGELKVTGNLTCNTAQYGNPGTITKTGAGTLIFEGTNNAYGLIAVEAGSLVLANGLTTANSGGLTLAEGAALTTGATIVHTGSGAVTLNGSITIDTADLKKFEMASVGGEVSYSDVTDGFMTTSGASYYLIKGSSATGSTATTSNGYTLAYGENGVTFVDSSSNTSEEYIVNTANAQSADGTFMYKLNSAEAVLNVNGTLSNSRIIMGEGKVAVSGTNMLVIDTASGNVHDLLTTTTGDGTIKLAVDATLNSPTTGSDATVGTGTLIIENAKLTFGTSDLNSNADKTLVGADISSFNAVELNNGHLYVNNPGGTIKNLTVTDKNGTLEIYDMGQPEQNKLLTFAETTTLNGDLTVKSRYNAQIAFTKLAGSKNLVFDDDARDAMVVSINGAENYSGKVQVKQNADNLTLTVAKDMGLDVEYYATSGTADLTGIGSGNTVTLAAAAGGIKSGTIAADVVVTNAKVGTNMKAGMEILTATDNSAIVYTGAFSGDGNYIIGAQKTVEVDNGEGGKTNQTVNVTTSTTFSGDTSGFTGQLRVSKGEQNITFTGDATAVKSNLVVDEGATANVTLNHSKAAIVTKDLSTTGTLNLTVSNSSAEGVTFTNKVTTDTTTIAAGTKATFNGTTDLGDLTLAAGASVTTSGALTLGSITLDLTNYEAGSYTLVSATDGGSINWTNNAWTNTGTLADGLTANVDFADDGNKTLQLVISEKVNDVPSITTTVVEKQGEAFLYEITGTTLTLTVNDSLAGLVANGQVSLGLISDEMMKAILTSLTNPDTGVVTELVTLKLTDGNELNDIVAGKDAIVGFYNKDGDGYWGEKDADGVVKYNVNRIPEPTTTTLSLLALCGLAARRRRK